jgi:hypothetical protein
MPCEIYGDGTTQIFSCRRGGAVTRCKCGRSATARCVQPLRGPKAGATCDRPLCDRCANAAGLCPPHARMAAKEKADG